MLHKNVLCNSTRGSSFFRGALNKGFEASATDLTKVLPTGCHPYVDTALDFMYGNDITFTEASALALCKVADVLQNDALMKSSLEVVCGLDYSARRDEHLIELALTLDLPDKVLKPWLHGQHANDILSFLAKTPHVPSLMLAIEVCAMKTKVALAQPAVARNVSCTHQPEHLLLQFDGMAVQRLHDAPLRGTRATCQILVQSLHGSGPTLGLSRTGANPNFEGCRDGGFATRPGCWGLCLSSGHLFAEGRIEGDTGHRQNDFIGQVVRMELRRFPGDKGASLRFLLESRDGGCSVLGNIATPVSEYEDLVFTACACCSHTSYAVMDIVDVDS